MPTIPRKKIKTLKQMEDLDLKKIKKSKFIDPSDEYVPDEDETIERDLVDIMRGKYEGE